MSDSLASATNAPWSAGDFDIGRLKLVVAEVAAIALPCGSITMSHDTLALLCSLFKIEKIPAGQGPICARRIYGLEVIFDESLPPGKYKLGGVEYDLNPREGKEQHA